MGNFNYDDSNELNYGLDQYENEPGDSEYEFLLSKRVPDTDGFMTDYTWYEKHNENGEPTYVFVFGDRDIYTPENGDIDWECDSWDEALEWFDSYENSDYEDEDEDEDYYDSSESSLFDESMRLHEKQMSDEDRHDTDILRGILRKSDMMKGGRTDYPLTSEEQSVLDKYDLDRTWWGGHIESRQPSDDFGNHSILDFAEVEDGYGHKDRFYDPDKHDKVNLADRARKMRDRDNYGSYLLYRMDNIGFLPTRQRAYGNDTKKRRWRSNTYQDRERISQNEKHYADVDDMKDALWQRKYIDDELSTIDSDYPDDIARENRKKELKAYRDDANNTINRLLKRDEPVEESCSKEKSKPGEAHRGQMMPPPKTFKDRKKQNSKMRARRRGDEE